MTEPICCECKAPATVAIRDMFELQPGDGWAQYEPSDVIWLCDKHDRPSRIIDFTATLAERQAWFASLATF